MPVCYPYSLYPRSSCSSIYAADSVAGEHLSHDDLCNLALVLLNAGNDTTRAQLAAAVQVFCNYPEQWALRAERAELAPKVVEEVMRHSPIIFNTIRKTTEDVELDEVLIPAGKYVIGSTAGANRDPAIYDEHERLDIRLRGRSSGARSRFHLTPESFNTLIEPYGNLGIRTTEAAIACGGECALPPLHGSGRELVTVTRLRAVARVDVSVGGRCGPDA